MKEYQKFIIIAGILLAAYLIPFDHPYVGASILEAFYLLQEYVREHVLFCLVPAFFIAGAIANFISQGAVIKYFGGQARQWVAYSVASVSGAILAVCSCTVLPLFSGIYRRGAGLEPAVAFLYSGPAINVLAIVLTARVLGWELGVARAIGAILFAVIIGLLMALIFRRDDGKRIASSMAGMTKNEAETRSPLQNIVFFAVMVLILIFATWGKPSEPTGFYSTIYQIKWPLVTGLLLLLGLIVIRWFAREERSDWVKTTWDFAWQILPLLFAGVLAAGLLMGRSGSEAGLIPVRYIETLVGGNSLRANLVASIAGAFMYFATLTEIPILQGLLGAGMGRGPALALLLAGPALSLPSMLVIRSVIGTKKTAVYIFLVVIMATLSGLIFGNLIY